MERIKTYLTSRDTEEREYAILWLTAFGIQSVVNLKPSENIFPIITRHIEGTTDISRTRSELREFYHLQHQNNGGERHREEEADKVAVRIVEYLLTGDFELSTEGFCRAHRHMFKGLYHNSGEFRQSVSSKKEWVLGNTAVTYPHYNEIRSRLDYLFDLERNINISSISDYHKIRHLSEFIAKLFVTNAFQYANSRVAFVYTLKYMLSLGYKLRNETFFREAWYFRNAIIRASYTNMHQGIYPTTEYMEMFLRNLFLNEDNELRNHRMVIRGD